MKLGKLLILSTILCFAHTGNIRKSASLLDRYINNLNNIDMTMSIELYDGNNKLDKKLKYCVVWPDTSTQSNEDLKKMIRVDVVFPKKLNKLVYWEHHKASSGVQRWITIPRNGKIKKIDSDNLLAKEFSSSKIDLSSFIDTSATFSFAGTKRIDSIDYCILNIESQLNKIKARVVLDTNNLVLKSFDLFNNRDIHTHSYNFSSFIDFEGKVLPAVCDVDDIKNKKSYRVVVSNLSSAVLPDSLFFAPINK